MRRLRLRSPMGRDVHDIRSAVGHGVHRMVGWSARPEGLADQLREIGMRDEGPLAAMVLTSPPQDAAVQGVEVRPVTSAEDVAAVIRIQHEAFAGRGAYRAVVVLARWQEAEGRFRRSRALGIANGAHVTER